jgi:hypothetical protein
MAKKPTNDEIIETTNEDTLDVLEIESNLADVPKPLDLPAGRYLGEITNVQQREGPKMRYYSVAFLIPPEEYPPQVREELEESYPDGVQLYHNRVMVPRSGADRRSIYRVTQFMAAIGLNTNTNVINPNDWMGQKATLVTRIGEWNGEKRPEIQDVQSAERVAPKAPRK